MLSHRIYSNRISLAFTLLIVSLTAHSEIHGQQGIFKSANDFVSNKVEFTQAHRIVLNDILYRPFISLKLHDTTLQFSKDSIFGFRDAEGKCYRFFNKSIYTIVSADENIILYQRKQSGASRGNINVLRSYFSCNAASDICELSHSELLREYADQPDFVELLYKSERNGCDLTAFDEFHHRYFIAQFFYDIKKTK